MNWIAIAALNLASAVALGAFGAHGLKSMASPEQLTWWQTGTLYFFFHALGLLLIGVLGLIDKINAVTPCKAIYYIVLQGIKALNQKYALFASLKILKRMVEITTSKTTDAMIVNVSF